MAKKQVDLSENSFLGALVIVASAVGSVVGVAALFIQDRTTLVAIAAGAAWALCFCLLVMNASHRKRIVRLEADLDEAKAETAVARSQADHWSDTASTVSQATLTVLQMLPAAPNPPPRRARTTVHLQRESDSGEPR